MKEKSKNRSEEFKQCKVFSFRPFTIQGQVSHEVCLLLLTMDMRVGSPFCVTQRAHYYSVTPLEASQFFLGNRRVGGFVLPLLKRSSTPLYGEGTLVNRPHSRGIKEPLHWFVLEAVLLICLPMNECIGPVFPLMWTMALEACINWPDVIPREWRALRGVWERLSSHRSVYSTNVSHKNGEAKVRKANRWPLTAQINASLDEDIFHK